MASFTEQLAAARRRAQLSGRSLTTREVSGISAGAAESASARLARAKGLSLQERGIETQEEQFTRGLGVRKSEFAQNLALRKEEIEAGEKAAIAGTIGNVATTAGTLYALKSFGGDAAAAAPSVTTSAGAGLLKSAPATTPPTGGLTGLQSGAIGVGIEVARGPVGEYAEEQVGTSAAHASNIASRAGQGALIGAQFGGGYGAAAGAIIGGGIGIAEEAGVSVICTELHRQGILSDEFYAADAEFGKKQDIDVIRGYHAWARPLARGMSRSRLLVAMVKPIALSWANHMAYIEGIREKPSIVGKFIHNIGLPVCRLVGRMKKEVQYG